MRYRSISLLALFVATGFTAFFVFPRKAAGQQFVPDVEGQFYNLTQYPEALGLYRTTTPDPSACKHYQGLARTNDGDGTPFFFMTKSGNTPTFPLAGLACNDSPNETGNGNLIVFRMDSRDKNGERLRSNRLQRAVHADQTISPENDAATIFYTVTEDGLVFRDGETTPQKVYRHPGGMQMIGNTLALAADTPRVFRNDICTLLDPSFPEYHEICDYVKASQRAIVMFYDVTTPESPQLKSKFTPRDSNQDVLTDADALGVTKLPDGKYLMVVGTGYNTEYSVRFDPQGNPVPYISKPRYFYFYRSNSDNLQAENLNWTLIQEVLAPSDNEDAHQALNFIRQGDINGQLYLAGSRGHIQIGGLFKDHDRLDLWKVNCDTANCLAGETLEMETKYHGRRLTPYASTQGGKEYANLAAAAGFYVSPSGELIFYAAQHDNDGPSERVNVAEWRYEEVVRPYSPTILPSAKIEGGPYEVDEGSAVPMTGSASPPVTRAWIQLYEEENYGGRKWIVDFDDREKDDYDNFSLFEIFLDPFSQPQVIQHHDKVRSWKWFAPVGCSIRAVDKTTGGTVDETVTLVGSGGIQRAPKLTDVLNDGGTDNIDQEMDALEFTSDCDAYYSTPFSLQWDLDANGSFETSGSAVSFSSAGFDGPSVVSVNAQAVSPASPGGEPGRAVTQVTVKNVAPSLDALSLQDSGGNQVGSTVPFVLTGSSVILSGGFRDPGLLDRQTASISWGDGLTQSNGAFSAFDEAFGDGIGSFANSHSYLTAGTFTIEAGVADDDSGADSETLSVRVLTPEQAVMEMVAMLDAAIASCTNEAVCADFRHVRIALAGSNPDNIKGALKMIRTDLPSAQAFLQTAGTWLDRATVDGATNLGTLKAIVLQVSAALAN